MNELAKICATCGTKFPNDYKESVCPICEDDRQYVPLDGQKWTNTRELSKEHKVEIKEVRPNLYEFVIRPSFAIGQRALFVVSESGNVLWDCIPMFDDEVVNFIKEKGGLKAIAISHPHYYSNMADWAEQFDCQIYLTGSEKEFVMFGSDRIQYWDGQSFPLWDGMEVKRIGGHFPGSSTLHIPAFSEKGALLCGDTFYLTLSMKHIAVMYSYPNRIPLPIKEVQRIKEKMQKIDFDEFYGFNSYQNLTGNPKELMIKSLERYR